MKVGVERVGMQKQVAEGLYVWPSDRHGLAPLPPSRRGCFWVLITSMRRWRSGNEALPDADCQRRAWCVIECGISVSTWLHLAKH